MSSIQRKLYTLGELRLSLIVERDHAGNTWKHSNRIEVKSEETGRMMAVPAAARLVPAGAAPDPVGAGLVWAGAIPDPTGRHLVWTGGGLAWVGEHLVWTGEGLVWVGAGSARGSGVGKIHAQGNGIHADYEGMKNIEDILERASASYNVQVVLADPANPLA